MTEELEKLSAAVATLKALNGTHIMTSEHRQKREEASFRVVDAIDPAIASMHEEITDLRKKVGALIHERDRALERADAAKATVDLWNKTGGHLPVVGLTCDTESCASAIGIVGVKAIDLSKVDDAMLAIATAARWSHETSEKSDEFGFKHYCPSCTKARKETKS